MKKKDKCVVCWQETEYEEETPVQERQFYIEGCGQLCEMCYKEIKYQTIANTEK